jgi:FdhE protein
MTTTTTAALEKLHRVHPEWKPWLSVIEAVLDECGNPRWDSFVPEAGSARKNEPRLGGLTVVLELESVMDWVSRLVDVAVASRAPRMSALKPLKNGYGDVIALFNAAIRRDDQRIRALAAERAADPDALSALAELVPVPFLQACGRRWAASLAEAWSQGFCPACAGWPAFAEVRGIDRSRYLRCGRCGADWQTTCLQCPYCNMSDHDQLLTLMPENGSGARTVEACRACRGYVKSFTVLQASPGAVVILEDLESVDLDIAAVEQGYRRAGGLGRPLEVEVVGKNRTKRKISLWNR